MIVNKIKDFLSHLFIPKEENNFRAKALHLDFLTYYLLIGLFLTFVFKYTPASNILGYATDITINKLYELTNREREKSGLAQLNYNEQLSQAAYQKASDMFAKNYWAHYGPDGETPWDFILKNDYQYEYAGENLAKNFLFSQNVVSAWMDSPTHRENILRKNYTDIGFAIVNGNLNGEPTTLVVQMLATPLEKTVAKTPVQIPQAPAILAKQSSQPKFNLFTLSFNLNLIFLFFLIIALVADFYFAAKLHIVRLGGKNLAHLIFISFVFIGLLLFTRGVIL